MLQTLESRPWALLKQLASQLLLFLVLPLITLAAEDVGSSRERQGSSPVSPRDSLFNAVALGGHARFDFYSADKNLDGLHNLPGLTFQPKSMPRFGSWGDAKIEGRITDQDLRGPKGPKARLLESYVNLYSSSMDVRVGKQVIAWGRADALNPTDNLTSKDFTLLSAKDEEERRTGTTGVRTNYYHDAYTLSLVWLPFFNPNTIPLAPVAGIHITEDKRDAGSLRDQGFAVRLADQLL